MAKPNLGQDVANESERKYTSAHLWSRYGSLIEIIPSDTGDRIIYQNGETSADQEVIGLTQDEANAGVSLNIVFQWNL